MTRVYIALAVSNLLVLFGAMALGYAVKDQRTTNMHVALSIFAAVLTCLVHVITFTYMTVIGKLTRQAVELGGLDREPRWKIDRLKAGVAIGLALGMLSTLVAVGTGATTLRSTDWQWLHQLSAWLALCINATVFYLGLSRVHLAGRFSQEAFEKYNQIKQPPQTMKKPATGAAVDHTSISPEKVLQ